MSLIQIKGLTENVVRHKLLKNQEQLVEILSVQILKFPYFCAKISIQIWSREFKNLKTCLAIKATLENLKFLIEKAPPNAIKCSIMAVNQVNATTIATI